jgi:hypothetical protein
MKEYRLKINMHKMMPKKISRNLDTDVSKKKINNIMVKQMDKFNYLDSKKNFRVKLTQ